MRTLELLVIYLNSYKTQSLGIITSILTTYTFSICKSEISFISEEIGAIVVGLSVVVSLTASAVGAAISSTCFISQPAPINADRNSTVLNRF